MRDKIKKIILLLLLCGVIYAQDFDIKPKGIDKGKRSLNTFRGIPFGSSKQFVVEHEKVHLEKQVVQGNMEMYFGKFYLLGMETTLIYTFINDEFLESMYNFEEKHSNKNFYIDDFYKVKETLVKKYGTPTLNDINWNNNLYSDEPDQYGLAISIGHLTYSSEWNLANGSIQLKLFGDNYDIKIVLIYFIDDFIDKRDKALELLNDF